MELTVWHNIYLKMISWQTAAHWPYVEAPFPFYLVFYDRETDLTGEVGLSRMRMVCPLRRPMVACHGSRDLANRAAGCARVGDPAVNGSSRRTAGYFSFRRTPGQGLRSAFSGYSSKLFSVKP